MRKFAVLNRLFRRTDNPVIATLYSHCIGRPLLVEPTRGEQLLAAYMQGAVDEVPQREPQTLRRIAIMNISGALASRPMPGPSGDGPMNYEEMSETFDGLMARPDIDAIVLRLDTPGGFADGLFDFTDQIATARGSKPIHAVVEHMAYSAGYAIAAAADDIWVTRTSGTGSVGAVTYHVDQSDFDQQLGVKVTAIYAGARKIDFSPHFALSDEAQAAAQAEINQLYDMFVGSVAAYRGGRGLTAKALRASEAGLFMGAAALEAGFADHLGTLHDALAHLAGSDPETPTLEDQTMSDKDDDKDKAAEAQRIRGVIADAIIKADLEPAITSALLKAGIAENEVEARIAHAKAVHGLCSVAGDAAAAVPLIARNVSLDDVRQQLTDAAVRRDPNIDIILPGTGGRANGPQRPATAAEIYASRRKQAQAYR